MRSFLHAIFAAFVFSLIVAAPARAGIADDIKATESERIAAYLSGNAAPLQKIFADELEYVHSSGISDTKAKVIESFTSGDLKITKFDREGEKIQQVGSVVIATAIGHVELTMKGKEAKFDLRYAAVYAKRGGVWQIFFYQGTRLPKAE
jgi:Domain of unknown function (DUF4440)